MFKAILNQQQQKLGVYRQLTLAFCSVAHLCILYACIFLAPEAGGTNSFLESLKDCINEIIEGGASKKAAIVLIIMLVVSSVAIIGSTTLCLRKNYILATEMSRGLLILLVCYISAYSGYVLFAALLCFVWLFCVHRFYKSTINQKQFNKLTE